MSDGTPGSRLGTFIAVALVGFACAQASSQEDASTRPLRLSDIIAPSPTAETPEVSSRWSEKALPGSASEAPGEPQPVSRSDASEAFQVGGSLAGVILLIFVLRAVIRKAHASRNKGGLFSRGKSPSGVASILARYPVGRGQQVVLLGVGKRILVVHQASGSMQTLSEITDPEEVAHMRAQINGEDRESIDRTFAPKLDRLLESVPDEIIVEPVDGMPGLVAEKVDLTAKRRRRLVGGVA